MRTFAPACLEFGKDLGLTALVVYVLYTGYNFWVAHQEQAQLSAQQATNASLLDRLQRRFHADSVVLVDLQSHSHP